MKRYVKKATAIFCALFCIGCLTVPVQAASLQSAVCPPLPESMEAVASFQNNLRGNLLSNGISKITNNGDGTVYLYGATYCQKTCDRVVCNLYLERLENGNWVSVTSRSYSDNNVYQLSRGVSLAVRRGYHYRVRGSHSVTDGGRTETQTSTTSGVYVK